MIAEAERQGASKVMLSADGMVLFVHETLMPFLSWRGTVGRDPTVAQLQERYAAVVRTIKSYRWQGLEPKPEWFEEAGIAWPGQ